MPAELATTLDATTEDRLYQAEALVRSYCGWHIGPSRTETVMVPGTGTRKITLPSMYVTAVTSVEQDGTVVASSAYTFNANGVITLVDTNARWSAGPVTVEFTHGYDPVPRDVEAVVQAVARRAVDNPGSITRQQAGPFSVQYSQSSTNTALPLVLLGDETRALARYAIPGIA